MIGSQRINHKAFFFNFVFISCITKDLLNMLSHQSNAVRFLIGILNNIISCINFTFLRENSER